MTSQQQPFFDFTERHLVGFFYKRGGLLKKSLQDLVRIDGVYKTGDEMQIWIGTKPPGFLINHYVTDISPNSNNKAGARCQSNIKLQSLSDLKIHLGQFDVSGFNPTFYTKKGYIPRGTLRTDGFRLQLLAFKVRELQSVRYRRLSEDLLPDRLTSTIGGTDFFLSEIRNVIRTTQDIEKLFPGVAPQDVKILTLDAGQAFVVGAYAFLPEDPDAHFNLSVSQKAVMQPVFRHRRWLEELKQAKGENGSESITEMESRLPPVRGLGASITNYKKALQSQKNGPHHEKESSGTVEAQLLQLYNGRHHRYKKHGWDMRRAKKAEFQAIAARLLAIVGGNIGERRNPSNGVIIGIGLGRFKSLGRLTSLHSAFLDYFIRLVSMTLCEVIKKCSLPGTDGGMFLC